MVNYPNLSCVQFYDTDNTAAGGMMEVSIADGDVVRVSVVLKLRRKWRNEEHAVLLLDKYRRYISHILLQTPDPSTEEFSVQLTFPIEKILNVPPDEPIRAYLFLPERNIALALSFESSVFEALEGEMRKRQEEPIPEVPSFRTELRELILRATAHKYVSRSSKDRIRTGNNYQTLDLGDTLRMGGRHDRLSKLTQVDFSDRTVLDIGANTGEVSRLVRRLGARLVDGIEYDPFFVETGRMINAYCGTTRVSLFQGDATNPAEYTGRYDLVLALSVYVYIKDVLDAISQISDALVLETHTLDHGLDFYLNALISTFPYFRHLGYTDADPKFKKSRALLLFSLKKNLLSELVNNDELLIPPGNINYYYGKKDRCFPPGSILVTSAGKVSGPQQLDEFLSELHDKYRDHDLELLPDHELNFFTETYWICYLLGYRDYLSNDRQVDDGNTFLHFYSKAIRKGILDPALSYLLDDPAALKLKIKVKYEDIDRMCRDGVYSVAPVYLSSRDTGGESFHFSTRQGRDIAATSIDGHHRLFLAKLFGCDSIPYGTSWDFDDPPQATVVKTRYTLAD